MSDLELYHYCCDHSAALIRSEGLLRPVLPPAMLSDVAPLLWLTNLETPVRDALGLTSQILSCDRTKHRFKVHPDDVHKARPWVRYIRTLPPASSAYLREVLDFAPYAMPTHWWVSLEPVRIL